MQVKSHWPSLLKKEVKLAAVVVHAPKFELSEDQLVVFLSALERPKESPPVAKGKAPAKEGVKPRIENDPKDSSSKPSSKPPTQPQDPGVRRPPSQPPFKKEAKPTRIKEESVLSLLQMKNASFILRANSGEVLAEVQSIDMSYPLKGEPGVFKIGKLSVGGENWGENLEVEVTQEKNTLKAVMEQQSIGPFSCSGEGTMDPRGGFRTTGTLEQLKKLEIKWNGATFTTEQVKLTGVATGALKKPHSCRGHMAFQAGKSSIFHPTKSVNLDSLTALMSLGSGELSVDSVEADSAEMKLRGFGKVNSSGESAGTVRVIATEDEALQIFRFFGGIQVHFPMVHFPHTQDILYNDVELRGKVWDLEFKTSNHWRKVRERLQRMSHFLNIEREEERERQGEVDLRE